MWQAISHQLSDILGKPFKITEKEPLEGGDINECYCIGDDNDRFFLKLNDRDLLMIFETEAESLRILNEADCIQVPQLLHLGTSRDKSFLVLNYLPPKFSIMMRLILSDKSLQDCTHGESKQNMALIWITTSG